MIEIDGSFGEGGGQILRTSLALSMITGTPFRLYNIRANRRRGGLQPQHLMCVTAAAEVSSADLSGAKVDSRDLTFRPREPKPGDYRFDIGTAGSTSLVLQTVLPALMTLKEPSNVAVLGGTHNDHAPPFEFLERAYLPVLKRFGPTVIARMERPGFYPVGGGIVHYSVQPVRRLARVDLAERGPLREIRCTAIVSKLNRSIAEREVDQVATLLCGPPKPRSKKAERRLAMKEGRRPETESASTPPADVPPRPEPIFEIVEEARALGPGNCVLMTIASDAVTEVFAGFGARGVPAESVASAAAKEALEYLSCDAPVGLHLADQLLLPMALGEGGSYVTGELTLHTRTNIEVIQRFLDVPITVAELAGSRTWIQVGEPREPAEPAK